MSRQIGDISAALAYQVKKEIAENFFGTRKNLEEERSQLLGQRTEILKNWTERVQPLLLIIYRLLIGEEEGRTFLSLINREDLLLPFRKPDINREGMRTPLTCPPSLAFTAGSKYRKWILALYQTAFNEAEALQERIRILQKKTELFNEDLKAFNTCFNLSEILSLTNVLEERDDLKCVLGENRDPQAIPLLEEKLAIKPLDLNAAGSPVPPPLPAVKDIKKPLSLLIDLTFRKYCSEIKKTMQEWGLSSSPPYKAVGRSSPEEKDKEAPPAPGKAD
jgi:hypothetical protein